VWVADRLSTNGTVVERHGAPDLVLEPGVATVVPAGTRVRFGGRWVVVSLASDRATARA
jgi:hypothetical protein